MYFTDFWLLRRRTLHLRDVYEPEGVSRYSFWWGVNPVALVSVAAGALTYYVLLNPITFESASVFRYTTATLPAFLVAGLVHYLLTRLVVIPTRKGGYADRSAG